MKLYTIGEEIFNSVTHGVGALVSVVGLFFLMAKALPTHDFMTIVACAIFGVSLIVLYLMSCLYHAIQNNKAKAILRKFDHSSIFILISGSYMPFLLITLKDNSYSIWIAAILWICTIVGCILNAISVAKFEKICMVLYIVMGWSAILVLKDIIMALPTGGLILLILGGLAYTGGIFFYKANKIRYMHSIWHLFVLAGSILHYFCVIFFVL